MRCLFIIILLIIPSCHLYSQTKVVRGRVIDNWFDISCALPIFIHDTEEVGKTDFDGRFAIEIPDSVTKIVLWQVGMDPTKIELSDKCNQVEVIMMWTPSDCFLTPRQALKSRKKRYKKLPELHKKAFDKGLFINDTACYLRYYFGKNG